jgi:hypothetical protein
MIRCTIRHAIVVTGAGDGSGNAKSAVSRPLPPATGAADVPRGRMLHMPGTGSQKYSSSVSPSSRGPSWFCQCQSSCSASSRVQSISMRRTPYRLVSAARRWYLAAWDVERNAWRGFRLDRLADPRPTGVRSRPADPPDAARFIAEGMTTAPYKWQVRVLLDAPASVAAALVPPTVAVIEAAGDAQCVLTSGSESLDAIAMHLIMIDIPFTPLSPPELGARCAVLARRLAASPPRRLAAAASRAASGG